MDWQMNFFDYFLLTMIGFSGLFATLRGLLREVVGILGWILAFVGASRYSGRFAAQFFDWIDSPDLRQIIAFVVIFITVLIIMGIIGQLIKKLASEAGLSALDRFLGLIFGLLRGVLIITIGYMIALHFDIGQPDMVSRSFLSPYFELGVFWLGDRIPPDWLFPGMVPTPTDPSATPL